MFQFSGAFTRTRVIIAAAAMAAGLGVWFWTARLPPIPQRPLRIGFEPNPPVQVRSGDGFAGLAVDAVNEAARRAKIRLEWVETGTSSEEAFRRGLVDLWPLMADLPERRKIIHFTSPWLHSGHALLFRGNTTAPDPDFAGTLAVYKMPLHVKLLEQKYPKARLLQLPEGPAVVSAVCTGRVAAAFMELRALRTALQADPPACKGVQLHTEMVPDLTLQLGIASTFEAAGAAERLRSEIRQLFRDGSLAVTMAKYSYYGLDDSWATYDLMETAERTRWMALGLSLLSIGLAVVIWRAVSARQRKRASAALKESEERFRTMADTAPVMIWVTNPDKEFTFVNKTWLNFTGRAMAQELGSGWAEGIHADDWQRCFDSFGSAFDARRNFQIECRLRRADGEYRQMLCTGVPRFASDGAFAGYIGSDVDITDLQAEQRFRQLAENIEQVFWMLDLESKRVLYVSPAFEKIWGRSPEPICRDRNELLETVHPEDRERLKNAFERVMSEPMELSYRIVRPDGSVRWIQDRSFPVEDCEGKPYRIAGLAEDITAHRELEEQLRQAHKMEAVGRLAGGIAHDFNNLLTVITGYSQMLFDGTDAADPKKSRLEQILAAANRASILTRQLLAFSRRQVRQPSLVNVNRLLTNMEALLRRVIGEHVVVETTLCAGLSPIQADPHQLEQVLMNLAANARDAMPDGGRFSIETGIVERLEVPLEGLTPEACTYVRLRISDTGCGMDDRTRERAFEPFFTTKGVGKGTGLGLSTVYGIVRQNGGSIRLASEPGQGTVFELFFPAVAEEKAAEAETKNLPSACSGSETILVAEDEPGVRGLVRETLKHLGYKVLEATDGYEALQVMEKHGNEIHLLLTDVIMPLMNGRDLAERLRSMRPGTKVLYMSGYTDDVLAFHGIAQPEIDFIQKPFTPSELAGKVEMVLAASRG